MESIWRNFFDEYLEKLKEEGIPWVKQNNEVVGRWNFLYFVQKGVEEGYEVHAGTRSLETKYLPQLAREGKWKQDEYLLDLCWCTKEEEWEGNRYWIELGLEQELSERKEDDIWVDFSKLMDIKAYRKVFICFPEEKLRENLPSELALGIWSHRLQEPYDSYLIIIFSEDRRRQEAERNQVEGYLIDWKGRLSQLKEMRFESVPII